MKKLLVFLLVFVTISTSFSFALTRYDSEAEKLKEIGVFKGTGNGFELERATNRLEGAIMFVRLLGAEAEAEEKKYPHPFDDVPAWGSHYVGYLYHNGLTKGISAIEFGSSRIEGNQAEIFSDYVQRIKNGEDLRSSETAWQTYNGFLEGRLIRIEMKELEDYVGITDDLGQAKRAANQDELLQGYGLIPYLNSKDEVLAFMGNPDWLLGEIDEFMQMKEDIEKNTNVKFYVIADIIISSKEDELVYSVYSEQYLGYTGESISEKVFNEYVK